MLNVFVYVNISWGFANMHCDSLTGFILHILFPNLPSSLVPLIMKHAMGLMFSGTYVQNVLGSHLIRKQHELSKYKPNSF